jgi:hypothetical protein
MPDGQHSLGRVKNGLFGAHEIASYPPATARAETSHFYFLSRALHADGVRTYHQPIEMVVNTFCPDGAKERVDHREFAELPAEPR